MADTMGTKEASEKWGYSQAPIRKWCLAGLIPDATHDEPRSPWYIPKGHKMPTTDKNKSKMKRTFQCDLISSCIGNV